VTSSRLLRRLLLAGAAVAVCATVVMLIAREERASHAEACASKVEAEAAVSTEAQRAMAAAASLLTTPPAAGAAYGSPVRGCERPQQGYDSWEYIRWVDSLAPGSMSERIWAPGSTSGSPVYNVRMMVGYYVDSVPQGLPCWCTMTVVKTPDGGWAIRRDPWNLQMVHMEQLYGEELRLWQERKAQSR